MNKPTFLFFKKLTELVNESGKYNMNEVRSLLSEYVDEGAELPLSLQTIMIEANNYAEEFHSLTQLKNAVVDCKSSDKNYKKLINILSEIQSDISSSINVKVKTMNMYKQDGEFLDNLPETINSLFKLKTDINDTIKLNQAKDTEGNIPSQIELIISSIKLPENIINMTKIIDDYTKGHIDTSLDTLITNSFDFLTEVIESLISEFNHSINEATGSKATKELLNSIIDAFNEGKYNTMSKIVNDNLDTDEGKELNKVADIVGKPSATAQGINKGKYSSYMEWLYNAVESYRTFTQQFKAWVDMKLRDLEIVLKDIGVTIDVEAINSITTQNALKNSYQTYDEVLKEYLTPLMNGVYSRISKSILLISSGLNPEGSSTKEKEKEKSKSTTVDTDIVPEVGPMSPRKYLGMVTTVVENFKKNMNGDIDNLKKNTGIETFSLEIDTESAKPVNECPFIKKLAPDGIVAYIENFNTLWNKAKDQLLFILKSANVTSVLDSSGKGWTAIANNDPELAPGVDKDKLSEVRKVVSNTFIKYIEPINVYNQTIKAKDCFALLVKKDGPKAVERTISALAYVYAGLFNGIIIEALKCFPVNNDSTTANPTVIQSVPQSTSDNDAPLNVEVLEKKWKQLIKEIEAEKYGTGQNFYKHFTTAERAFIEEIVKKDGLTLGVGTVGAFVQNNSKFQINYSTEITKIVKTNNPNITAKKALEDYIAITGTTIIDDDVLKKASTGKADAINSVVRSVYDRFIGKLTYISDLINPKVKPEQPIQLTQETKEKLQYVYNNVLSAMDDFNAYGTEILKFRINISDESAIAHKIKTTPGMHKMAEQYNSMFTNLFGGRSVKASMHERVTSALNAGAKWDETLIEEANLHSVMDPYNIPKYNSTILAALIKNSTHKNTQMIHDFIDNFYEIVFNLMKNVAGYLLGIEQIKPIMEIPFDATIYDKNKTDAGDGANSQDTDKIPDTPDDDVKQSEPNSDEDLESNKQEFNNEWYDLSYELISNQGTVNLKINVRDSKGVKVTDLDAVSILLYSILYDVTTDTALSAEEQTAYAAFEKNITEVKPIDNACIETVNQEAFYIFVVDAVEDFFIVKPIFTNVDGTKYKDALLSNNVAKSDILIINNIMANYYMDLNYTKKYLNTFSDADRENLMLNNVQRVENGRESTILANSGAKIKTTDGGTGSKVKKYSSGSKGADDVRGGSTETGIIKDPNKQSASNNNNDDDDEIDFEAESAKKKEQGKSNEPAQGSQRETLKLVYTDISYNPSVISESKEYTFKYNPYYANGVEMIQFVLYVSDDYEEETDADGNVKVINSGMIMDDYIVCIVTKTALEQELNLNSGKFDASVDAVKAMKLVAFNLVETPLGEQFQAKSVIAVYKKTTNSYLLVPVVLILKDKKFVEYDTSLGNEPFKTTSKNQPGLAPAYNNFIKQTNLAFIEFTKKIQSISGPVECKIDNITQTVKFVQSKVNDKTGKTDVDFNMSIDDDNGLSDDAMEMMGLFIPWKELTGSDNGGPAKKEGETSSSALPASTQIETPAEPSAETPSETPAETSAEDDVTELGDDDIEMVEESYNKVTEAEIKIEPQIAADRKKPKIISPVNDEGAVIPVGFDVVSDFKSAPKAFNAEIQPIKTFLKHDTKLYIMCPGYFAGPRRVNLMMKTSKKDFAAGVEVKVRGGLTNRKRGNTIIMNMKDGPDLVNIPPNLEKYNGYLFLYVPSGTNIVNAKMTGPEQDSPKLQQKANDKGNVKFDKTFSAFTTQDATFRGTRWIVVNKNNEIIAHADASINKEEIVNISVNELKEIKVSTSKIANYSADETDNTRKKVRLWGIENNIYYGFPSKASMIYSVFNMIPFVPNVNIFNTNMSYKFGAKDKFINNDDTNAKNLTKTGDMIRLDGHRDGDQISVSKYMTRMMKPLNSAELKNLPNSLLKKKFIMTTFFYGDDRITDRVAAQSGSVISNKKKDYMKLQSIMDVLASIYMKSSAEIEHELTTFVNSILDYKTTLTAGATKDSVNKAKQQGANVDTSASEPPLFSDKEKEQITTVMEVLFKDVLSMTMDSYEKEDRFCTIEFGHEMMNSFGLSPAPELRYNKMDMFEYLSFSGKPVDTNKGAVDRSLFIKIDKSSLVGTILKAIKFLFGAKGGLWYEG